MVTADDLRIQIGFSTADWTADDALRADAVLARARRVVVALAGSFRVARAEAVADQDKLDAVDEATMAYAIQIFANPERALQRRQGSDYSVSFSDSSEAAGGMREVRAILEGAFGVRAGTMTL